MTSQPTTARPSAPASASESEAEPPSPPATTGASQEYLAMAAHELRGPAGVIQGAAETLEAMLATERLRPEVGELLSMLARNARHLRKLTVDVLSSSYLARGDLPLALETTPLLPVIGWAIEATAPATGSVQVECAPDLTANVDPAHLEQILTNLVSNALQHGAAPVVISARPLRDATGAQVAVRDAGQGVSADDAPALFDRFSPLAARSPTSTGLGLSISRGLARAMGGDLTYQNGESGSLFLLTLQAS